jgi:hypothetical protein
LFKLITKSTDMKKALIGLSGVIMLTLVVVLFVNAKNSPQDVKKTTTEQKADCGKCPSKAGCGTMAEAKTTETKTCDPAKCKEAGCDPAKCKEGKCDDTTCKAKCKSTGGDMKNCDPAKCTGMAKK